MKSALIVLAVLLMTSVPVLALEAVPENPQIDAKAFKDLSEEALKFRESRRVEVKAFMEMAQDKDTIILDARSKQMYDLKHIKGAVNLNFADFSVRNLAKVIPTKETRVLIYCNNNFTNDSAAFVTKAVPLSLNVPTFINLYGYGYKNIYELGPALDENNTELKFEVSKAE